MVENSGAADSHRHGDPEKLEAAKVQLHLLNALTSTEDVAREREELSRLRDSALLGPAQ